MAYRDFLVTSKSTNVFGVLTHGSFFFSLSYTSGFSTLSQALTMWHDAARTSPTQDSRKSEAPLTAPAFARPRPSVSDRAKGPYESQVSALHCGGPPGDCNITRHALTLPSPPPRCDDDTRSTGLPREPRTPPAGKRKGRGTSGTGGRRRRRARGRRGLKTASFAVGRSPRGALVRCSVNVEGGSHTYGLRGHCNRSETQDAGLRTQILHVLSCQSIL